MTTGNPYLDVFISVGKAVFGFLTKPAVQLTLFVAQGVMSHQAAMKAKRTGADILLQKYGTGGGIPVIYGTRRVAGTVVYMETQNNRELYVVYAIAGHEIDSFDLESIQLDGRTIKDTKIYRQGYDISDGTNRVKFRPSAVTRTSGTFWGNTSTERANITGGANTNNKARMTFNCHKGTTTQAADPMLEGILTNWTSNHKLSGIAYIAANYEYDTQGMFTGIPNLTIVVNGKKVFDPRDTGQTFGTESTYTHSSNAALCLLDYITNDDYGKGLGTSDLESDFASWKTAADDCDTSVDTIDHTGISVESASTTSDTMIIADASQAKFNKLKVGSKYTVDDGTTTYVNNKKLIDKDSTQIDLDGSNPFAILKLKFEDGAIDNAISSATSCDFEETQIRFDCNGVLDTEETVLENTKLLIANMRGIFTYANGEYQVKVEGTESSVVTLDEDDILESGITLSLENKEAKFNKVEAEFYNAQKRYESDTTYYTGETSDTFLSDDGNEVLETRIQLPFCTNQRIAYNHAKGLLKRSRKQKTISFVATPKVLKAKVGEVITVSNTNLNLSSELYRITNMTINPDLNIAVTAIEYQTDVYGYVTPPDEDIDIPDDPPEGNRVVAPTNLTFTNKNATTGEAAKLTWTDSTKYPSYEFRVRIIDGLKTRYDKRVQDTYFYLDGISVKNGYVAKVSAINALGTESDSTDITVNVTTEPITTPDIKQGSIGGFSFTASKMYHPVDGSDTGTFETSNVYIDDDGQFSLKDKLSFDGTDLTIDGDITATTGTIGGFSIGSNFLTAGSATSRIKLSTADGIHMGNDTFALAPFNVTKSGQVTATDLILKKGNVTYFDSTDGFSAEAIAQIASSLNTRVQTFAFSSENNTDYATIETTEDSQDIKLVVRANASNLQGSGTTEALAIADIPDNLTIKIEFDDNTSFTSPTTIGSLQTYNASTDGTPTTSEYEIETLDLSALGGDFSAFVLGNQGAVNTSGDIVYTVSSYTVATAGTYYFRVIYDTTDTTFDATNDPENFTRSLEIEDLSGNGFLISNGSSGSQTSEAVTISGTQTITGAKTFSATTAFSGNVNISGDLSVTGTTTTIDTATLNVEDKNITLNYSTGDSSSTADGAGITIQDAVNSTTDATILWDATNDEFDFSHGIIVDGTSTDSGFLSGSPAFTTSGYIYTKGIINEGESGTAPAGIVFGNGSTYGADQISLITSGNTAVYIASNSQTTFNYQTHFEAPANFNDYVYVDVAGTNLVMQSDTSARQTIEWKQDSTRLWTLDLKSGGHLDFVSSNADDELRYNGSEILASGANISVGTISSGVISVGGTNSNSSYGVWLQNNKWYASQYSDAHDVIRFNANTSGELDFYNQTDSAYAGVRAGLYRISTTTVIDGSRNLTNIGTYSGSGDMTISKSTTPTLTIETSATSNNDAFLKIRGARTASSTSDIGKIEFDNKTSSPYTLGVIRARDPSGSHTLGRGSLTFSTSSGGTLSDALVLGYDQSATFSGTISSGNITASGTGVTSVKIQGNYPVLYFEDTAGSDIDAYIANNANGLFFGKTNSPSGTNDVMMLDLTNQRVGIGTSSPSHGLTVSDSISGTTASRRITIQSTTHGVNAGYRFNTESANGTTRNGGYYFQPQDGANDSYLGLTATDGAYQMVVTAGGLVGIGKTPSTWFFDVDSSSVNVASFDGSNNTGVVINSGSSTIADIIGYSNSASTYNALNIRSASGTGIHIDTSNAVGIKLAPLSPFTLRTDYNGITTNSGYSSFFSTVSGAMAIFGHNVKPTSTANTVQAANTGYHSHMIRMYYDHGIAFHTTSSTQTAGTNIIENANQTANERMRITPAGNVGVGTSAPSRKLTVNGNMNVGNASINGRNMIEIQTNDNTADRGIAFRNSANAYSNVIFAEDVGGNDARLVFTCGNSTTNLANVQRSFMIDNQSGGSGVSGDIHARGDVVAFSSTISSDERLKYDIEDIKNPLDIIQSLKGRHFKWKKNDQQSSGVIAQEVEQSEMSFLVSDKVNIDNPDETIKRVKYDGFIGVLIEAIKEQQKQIDELKAKLK